MTINNAKDADLFVDPWLQKGRDQILPIDVQFVCKYRDYPESAFQTEIG